MRAVVHAGMNKTGTTSFQKACREAQERLRKNGIYYPDLSTVDPESSFPICHADIPRALMAGKDAEVSRYLEFSRAHAEETRCELTLFSSESISSLIWRPKNLDTLTRSLEELFDSYEYVLVVRNMRSIFKSHLKQFIVHFGCDLSPGFENLHHKLDSILFTASEFIRLTSPRLRLARYEDLSSAGLCNSLLRFCCSTVEISPRVNLLEEEVSNSSEAFSRDLFQLMTPLFRALIAVSEGGVNPYSRSVNEKLEALIDRKRLSACLGEDAALDDVASLVDQGLSTISDRVVSSGQVKLYEKYPDLHKLGMI